MATHANSTEKPASKEAGFFCGILATPDQDQNSLRQSAIAWREVWGKEMSKQLSACTGVHLLIVMMLSGCALIPGSDRLYDATVSGRVYSWEWKPQLQYGGFYVETSPGFTWFLKPGEQRSNQGIFRLRGTDTHSKYVSVDVFRSPHNLTEPEDLLAYVKPLNTNFSDRGALITYEQSLGTSRSAWCVSYRLTALDKNPANSPNQPLKMVTWGEFCRHPTLQRMLFNIQYSERGLEEEVAKQLPDDATQFMTSIKFDPANAIPAHWKDYIPEIPVKSASEQVQ